MSKVIPEILRAIGQSYDAFDLPNGSKVKYKLYPYSLCMVSIERSKNNKCFRVFGFILICILRRKAFRAFLGAIRGFLAFTLRHGQITQNKTKLTTQKIF